MHYWINVDKSEYRYEFMKEQFDKLNIVNERISARTPDDIDFTKIIKNQESKSNPAEYACILSHLKAIQIGYDEGYEYFFILEDDINIIKINQKKLINLIKTFEKKNNCKIDILQLHTNSHPLIIELYNELGGSIINRTYNDTSLIKIRDRDYPSTGYYLISREGAKKLLDKFVIDFKNDTYDLSYSAWCAADNVLYRPVNTYILLYPIVTSNIKCGSLIHEEHIFNHDRSNEIIALIHKNNNLLHLLIE